MKMKICTKCGDEKPLDEYYVTTGRGGKKGRSGRCKTCICEAQKSKRLAKKNPEAVVYINGKETKFCNTCETHKYLEDFGVLRKNKDGRHTKCRACQKEYQDSYYANEDNRKKRLVTTAKRYREQLEEWSKTDLKTKVCRSCGEEKSLDEFYAKGRETQCKVCKCQEQKDKRKPHLKRKTLFLDGKEAKLCRTCDTVKVLENFAIAKRMKGQGRASKCKECQSKYYKAFYADENNRQRKQAKGKEWQEANREKVLAKAARYREANREKINKGIREHYQKNKDSEHYKKVKREYYENTKEQKLQRQKVYRKENHEVIRIQSKKYREANKDKLAAKSSAWYQANKERHRKKSKSYMENNRERMNEWGAKYVRERKANDVDFKLRHSLRRRLWSIVSKNSKTGSAVRDLGCSVVELKKYLESQFNSRMNWKNWGTYWEIDHIYPLNAADLQNRVEFLAVNNWRNLQPLTEVANGEKKDKVTPEARKLFNKLKKEFSKKQAG